jgi:hypothetical protein
VGRKRNKSYGIQLNELRNERMKDETYERERESKREGRMRWTSLGAWILMWRYLEEGKKFLSALGF